MALVAELSEFKAWLRIAGSADDAKLLDVLTSASEWVEWRIGGPLEVTEITEELRTRNGILVPTKRPLVDVVSVTPFRISGDAQPLPATSYRADTTNGLILLWGGYGRYTTVYEAGLAEIPYRAKNAGMELGRHLWLTQNGSVGRGRNDDDVPTPMGFAVPRRVDELLASMPDAIGGFA